LYKNARSCIIHNNPKWDWTGGAAQAVEHLLCKYDALSSNISLTKKKKKEEEERKELLLN
jgi:hypothetical protein